MIQNMARRRHRSLQHGPFLPIYECTGATAAVKCPHVLQFCGKAALTSCCRADKNRALFAAGGELRQSERPFGKSSKDKLLKDMLF
jgi:hypothetical protein